MCEVCGVIGEVDYVVVEFGIEICFDLVGVVF